MKFRKFALSAAVFMAVQGCDCNKTTAQIQAQKVMVATVLSTPAIVVKREAIAGFDASFPFFDGGIPSFDGGFCPFGDGGCAFDAGQLPNFDFDGGSLTIPEQTGLFVFFGTREGGLTSLTPIANASVKAEVGGQTFQLDAQMGGTHTLTSQDDSSLKYQAGESWKFTATADNLTFIGEVTDTPVPERIKQLHPDEGYIDIAIGTDYHLTRPDPEPGGDRLLGFVTVIPISTNGSQGQPTYTNVPTTPLGFVKLVAAPSEWKQTVVVIPGTAFPTPDTNYLILMQSAKLGFASTDNLFIGSAMIAGVADVGVVKTRK